MAGLFKAYCWKCEKGVGRIRKYHDSALEEFDIHCQQKHFGDGALEVGYSIIGPCLDKYCVAVEIDYKRTYGAI